MKNRDELVERYINGWLDNLDLSDLYVVAFDCIKEKMDKLSDEEVLAEIEMVNPELLEQMEEE